LPLEPHANSDNPEQLHKGGNTMELLPQEVREKLPPLYAQEGNPEHTVHVKFFTPDANWTWYATEGGPEGDDFIFFGYVIGLENEWGYFSLNELRATRGPLGLFIERDLHFTPAPISEVLKREGRGQD
jgi:hypothetical protein